MIVVMRPGATRAQVAEVRRRIEAEGLEAFVSAGEERTVIGVVGVDLDRVAHLGTMEGVERVLRVTNPYKLASVEHHPERTRVRVRDVDIGLGGGEVVVMAGPCSVESDEQLKGTARLVAREGARILRGGAFKPRTSPYTFQGLGLPALQILAEAREETGMPVISEVTDPGQVELFDRYVDLLQVGSRNMHNFVLLRAVGQSSKPVLLKRGFGSTIEEWLLAAEYVLSSGNPNLILCERGIRTFETATRNTLDLSAVPVLRERTHLPIVVDPSHGTGQRSLVGPMALAAAAVGADGLLIEVHPDPPSAKSDGDQSLSFEEFGELMDELRRLRFVRSHVADQPPVVGSGITDLAALRARIDELDSGIVTLLQERAAVALEVQQLRGDAHGHDVTREQELLERAAAGDGVLTPDEMTMVFGSILRASRSAQRRHAGAARGET
jgi:3-deoxy-7-phosphoheptulonate synthase